MAGRNADCAFERSLRSKQYERPQPLRRGQGVGGGNYHKVSSTAGGGRTAARISAPRPSSVNQGGFNANNRSKSLSPNNSRPGTASSVGTSSSCPQNVTEPSNRQIRAQRRPETSKGGQRAEYGQTRTSVTRPSSAGNAPNFNQTQGTSSRGDNRLTASCPPSKGRLSVNNNDNAPTRNAVNTQSRNRYQAAPQASNKPIPNERLVNKQPRVSVTAQSQKPGPSCIKPSNQSDPSTKRRVQFTGVPSSQGSNCLPETRAKFKSTSVIKVRSGGAKKKAASSSCEAVPSRGGNQNQIYGPSLYPIYPDQYETPYVTLPGPRQVLLMPGDINPNETTIIDIVGLDEGDVVDVPGIPPPAPANLLQDTWNEFVREAEQGTQRQRGANRGDSKRISSTQARGKKNNQQTCNSQNLNLIKEGRAFSYEEHGNVRIEDPNSKMYAGPSFQAPDPECQRARPYTYSSRKTSVRPFTDEERREIEEAQTYRAIRAIINEHDARWESDRTARGLTDDDLLDIDAEDCAPKGMTQAAPKDIFEATDNCEFDEPYLEMSNFEPSPVSERCQYPKNQDLIAWDEDANMPPSNCTGIDLMTKTPPRSPQKGRLSKSPNLMSMWEPDVDLIGMRTPPRTKTPSPMQQCERDDLIRWNAIPQRSLPFDEPCEETFFDMVARPSPPSARVRSAPMNSNLPRAPQSKGRSSMQQNQRPDFGGCPSNEPRVVRAIPMENDPNIVVLEGSPLASKKQSPDKCGPEVEDLDEDDSLGILDLESFCVEQWQELDNLIDEFDAPQSKPERSRASSNMSGIAPLEECAEDDDDDLGILEEDCYPELEFSVEAEARLQNDDKYQELCRQLAEDAGLLEQESCPFEPDFEEFDRQYEEERANLLNLCQEPDFSPPQRQNMGRLGSELIQQCQDPIEQCADLLGILGPNSPSPQKRMGPFSRELLENCPEEQQLIDVDDECPPVQPPCPPKFNYSRDLFTNVQWDPSMAPNPPGSKGKDCSR